MSEKSREEKVLKHYFGYDSFRPMQHEIIQYILEGNDAVVLMPTGGGKSICFQIPAMIFEGVTVVVSPLISLMKDQVESLLSCGIKAAFINSSLDSGEEESIINGCRSGEIKLLYVSPERLATSFDTIFETIKVSLVAVDEAHCISTWGHDFRQEYARLNWIKRRFPNLPVVALTATADKTTRNDIVNQLELDNPKLFVTSFNRPNLSLDVRTGITGPDKNREIVAFIQGRIDESGIIYATSRKSCEKLAEMLSKLGINAAAYHAGLAPVERSRVQEHFIKDKVKIVCATVAFGMGIDKSNVRWVIHYNLPKNIESYYQEIGRAGRDGLDSETILYFNLGDLMMLRGFAEESGQAEINVEKLKRMQQFAEADICRRKILLSYFGEHGDKDCGNCDVCKNPPQTIDGTIIAQKALSAVYRLKEKTSINITIDVLKGSQKEEVISKGYHKIKTFGAGYNIHFLDWQQYFMQFLQLGLLEMMYEDNYSLKITHQGREVLFDGRKVNLIKPLTKDEREKRFKVTKKKSLGRASIALMQSGSKSSVSQRYTIDEDLFQDLRELRKELAIKENKAAYIIFSDTTLKIMSAKKPKTREEMLDVSGVGEAKLEKYGDAFLAVINGDILLL